MTDRTEQPATPETAHAGTPSAGVGAGDDSYEGREIVLVPLAPGLWPIILGAMFALLAPLGGFLVGSMLGPGDGEVMSPLFVALFVGIIVGAVGAVVAITGALRMLRSQAPESS